MNKFKKAISVGMSAALLASLFTVIAVPAALAASTTVTGGGPINPGGPASTPITISATESAVTDWVDGAVVITLTDAAGASTITFTGTPVVTASGGPAPFACSGALGGAPAGSTLTITCTGATATRLDSFTVTGLSVKASAAAAIGGVVATWAGALALGTTNATASGTLTAAVVGGAAPQVVGVTLNAGSAAFQVTSATPPPSTAAVAGGAPEAVSLTAVAAPVGLAQNVTGVFLLNHTLGTAITQTVVLNQLTGLPVVGDTISVCDVAPSGSAVATFTCPGTSPAPAGVRQGLNNQLVNGVLIDLGKAGFVATGSTLTIAASAGGVFSNLPVVGTSGTFTLSAGVLSFDRSTVTYTVTVKSTTDSAKIRLDNVRLDVSGTAAQGSVISARVTPSPAVAVVGSPVGIAQVGSNLIGVGGVPNVLIGFNDQPTGLLTLTETAAGTLSDDVNGTTNIVRICLNDYDDVYFLRQPWAVRTSGDIQLNNGGVAATQVKMTLSPGGECASFLIYSQSTVASTIEIRGGIDAASSAPLATGPNNGPKISVTTDMDPGPVAIQVKQFNGVAADLTGVTGTSTGPLVIVAMATFSGSPAVTAVTQPLVLRGGVNQLVGEITIQETQAGQFGNGEEIDLCLVPRSLSIQQDVFFSTASTSATPTTSNQPIVSTNNVTGLVARFDGFTADPLNFFQSNSSACLTLEIVSAPVSGLGTITVKNIRYDVTADAAFGAVLLRVFNDESGGPAAGSDFSQTVSNARVGAVSVAEATINRGLNTRSGFGFTTETVAKGSYITLRSRASGSAPGDLVQVWVKTKTTPWVLETSRRVSPNGFMYYSGKVLNSGYRYYRVLYVNTGAISNTVRAFGR